jgi:adenylate cyclase
MKGAIKGAMKQWRQRLWPRRGLLAIAPTLAIAVILLRSLGLFQAWEWAVFDQYMRLRPLEPPDSRIVLVGLDENDVSELGQAIVPDGVYAEVIEKLRSQSPRAIGLDIYRDLPVEPGHSKLSEIFRTTPNLVGIQKVVGEKGRETVSAPDILANLGQVGANDIITDADNTVRRGLLSVQTSKGETVYSLALYLALLYLEPENIGPKMVDTDTWWLGKTLFRPFESSDGGYIQADANGYQQILNYRGHSQTFEQVSVSDVLHNRIPSNWATDRIVLIGAVGDSFQDNKYTPYSSSLLSFPEPMAGVEVHAHLTSQIISSALDGRATIRSWPEAIEWLWILGWSGMGVMVVWQYGQAGKKPLTNASNRLAVQSLAVQRLAVRGQREGLVIGLISLLLGSSYGLFLYGWWIPIVPALVAAVGSAAAVTAYLAHRAGDIRRTFGRYLSDEIVNTILENPAGQKLGGERRKITILTSDLRGFTSLSERLEPEKVIQVLNYYLGCMTDVITRHNGTIDEFMGDGILVLFGAPIRRETDAQRAIACAIEMQLAMEDINKTVQKWELAPLEMGIGIHTGEVVVGNIGSEKRTKYGVVGGPVNLTYRIEACTIGGQILISQETLECAGDSVQIAEQQTVSPKGVTEPITIHEVAGIGAPYHLRLTHKQELFSPLAVPILIRFRLIQEKQASDSSFIGQIISLSDKGALVETEAPVANAIEPLSNLKINFLSLGSTFTSQDVYAKTIKKVPDQNQLRIHFTAMPPALIEQLKANSQAA